MPDLDQLGSFYLGRRHDMASRQTLAEPLLYDSKDLTTHAVCVGMTGSGKTGLCVSLLEEAALNGIPAIAIDPKGDLGNLLLAFPNLEPADFRPWVDESEARRKQMTPDQFAAAQATLWRDGLAKWGQSPERIRRYCDAAERVIYTPGSSAGIPISVLDSFHAPTAEVLNDSEALTERISSVTSGLLGLLGVDADPVRSREHVFLANVIHTAWAAGEGLDLPQLMRYIQRPPLSTIGVVDVDTFFPPAERSKLAMGLNSLLASPSFGSWLAGEPLDIGQMLYTPAGRPRLAIVSIAHLDDAQRMFFVTLLLNEVLAWARSQPGTSSLRALVYMDEVFGYFPPSANPPSKLPMLTLLKQARAFGLGCVLATQNPVDLDYKGLSNAGTWFLGRLQTERDKARMMDGLEGASAQAGASFDRRALEATLAGLDSRVFLMHNVHNDAPVIFHSRWAMSYLCGPLARDQIKRLMDPLRSQFATSAPPLPRPASHTAAGTNAVSEPRATSGPASPRRDRPILSAKIREQFAPIVDRVPDGYQLEYRPALFGSGKIHFVHSASKVDVWREYRLLTSVQNGTPDNVWANSQPCTLDLQAAPEMSDLAHFAALPGELAREQSYATLTRQLKEHLYRHESLQVWKCEAFDESSRAGETLEAFRARLVPLAAERLAAELHKLRSRYAGKLADAEAAAKRREAALHTQRWQFWSRFANIIWVAAETVLRSLGHGRSGRPRSAEVAVRQAATEHGQRQSAQLALEQALGEQQRLAAELAEKVASLEKQYQPEQLTIEPVEVSPRKADTEVDPLSLVWLPWRVDAAANAQAVF